MKKAFPSILFLFSLITASAQENFLRHYSINEGLPGPETYSVFQDSQGYIWIASDMGVSRFDGYVFKVYTTADGLTDNTVFKFYEDSRGRIWFYTFSGQLCYYQDDTIYGKDFPINKRIREFLGSELITDIRLDTKDTILVASWKGLIKVIPTTDSGKCIWNSMEILNTKATLLLDDGYITAERPFNFYTRLDWYRGNHKTGSVNLPKRMSRFNSLFRISDQRLLCSSSSFTAFADSGGMSKPAGNITSVISTFEEGDTDLWIGESFKGVQLYSMKNFTRPKKSFLKTMSVTGILKDHEAGYWFTTLEDGVFYLPSSKFSYFNPTPNPLIYNETSLSAINEDKVWMITANGIMESKNLCDFTNVNFRLALLSPAPKITAWWNALAHSDSTIWISTSEGILVVDSKTGKCLNYINLFFYVKKYHFKGEWDSRLLIEDHLHNVWSLTYMSLTKIDHRTKEIVEMIPLPARAQTLCEDPEGNILIGTVSGLYRLCNDSLHFLGEENKTLANRFVDIKRSGGQIIGATRGAGLFILSGDSIRQITTADGLLSNMCRSIFVDNQDVIWLATNKGLNGVRFTIHPFKTVVSSYTTSDGLPTNDIQQIVKSGKTLWVLTKKGITAFNPKSFAVNLSPPPVYITRIKIDNVVRVPEDAKALSYTTNFIGIDFVGLTYKNAGKQEYKYRLEGYDSSWTYTKNTFVQFTKLPPGDYKFIVSCMNNSGIESSIPAVFSFTINTPFYLKWWFAIALFLIIVLIIIIISVFFVRRIRKQAEIKTETNRKIANLQLQAIRAQMNPHFVFNCLAAIRDFIVKNDPDSAQHYLSNFSKLVRIVLDNSRKQSISLAEEINFLHLYIDLEQMRFNNKFSYEIMVGKKVEIQNVQIPSMIIQPFIENSIRHGRIGSLYKQGNLNINFDVENNLLICQVDDNGIGINRAMELNNEKVEQGDVHALNIISDHITTINEMHQFSIRYTIEDKSNIDATDTGTHAEISIPIITDNDL